MAKPTWTVVKFMEDESVEAVPTSWLLDNNMCYWPTMSSEKNPAAIRQQELNTCWPIHPISSFRNATYEDYLVARGKAKKAEDTSDLNSESENIDHPIRRKPKINRKLLSSSEDDDDDSFSVLMEPPKLPLTLKLSNRIAKKNLGTELSQLSGSIKLPIKQFNAIQAPGTELVDVLKPLSIQDSTIHQNKGPALQEACQPSQNNCQCCTVHKNGYVLERVLNQQHIIRALLKDLLEEIRNKNQNQTSDVEPRKSFFEEFDFPFNNETQLAKMDELLTNETNFKWAFQQLKQVGGTEIMDFVKRVFRLLMEDALAMEYSWLGMKKKKIFKDHKIARAIIVAAIEGDLANTNKEVEKAIKKYLRRARERYDKKIERSRKQQIEKT